MKQRKCIQWVLFLLFALLAVFGSGCGGGSSSHSSSSDNATPAPAEVSAADAIVGVTTIAFTANEGPKVQAIVVEYDTEVLASSLSWNTYEIFTHANMTNHGTALIAAMTSGEPGAMTNYYVSKTADIDPNGQGVDSGKFVIIEVNTHYRIAFCSNWRTRLTGGVIQKLAVSGNNLTVLPSDEMKSNYELTCASSACTSANVVPAVIDDSLYTLKDLDGYQIYTDLKAPATEKTGTLDGEAIVFKVPPETRLPKVAGGTFKATNCWSEVDGDRHSVDVMYSIFVPKDYDAQVAAGKKFALAVHIEDAGQTGTDPMYALAQVGVAANYASDRVQKIVKDQGFGGLIVVLPQILSTGIFDNLTASENTPAVWQLMDSITGKYAIDTTRIYGSGQSMGGMMVLYMASHRDNYFAGIWSIGSQWGNNYKKDAIYPPAGGGGWGGGAGHPYYVFPDDEPFITNPDWKNYFYSVSDDNILATNMTGDPRSSGYWAELKELYETRANTIVPKIEWDPIYTPVDDQNFKLQVLTSQPNATGIYWSVLSNGDHMATWAFAHALDYAYDWLLRQTQSSISRRGKLAILNQDDPVGTRNYSSVLK